MRALRVLQLFLTPFNVLALLVLLLALGIHALQERPAVAPIDPALLQPSGGRDAVQASVRLFFASVDAESFLREERVVRLARNTTSERASAAIRAWQDGPRASGALKLVPSDLDAPTVLVRRDTAFVDLPRAWTSLKLGSAGELLVICGLTNTLLELGDLTRVQFLVDGQPAESLAGHVAILEPLTSRTCRGT